VLIIVKMNKQVDEYIYIYWIDELIFE
jgi:hypothetical protein